VRDLRRDAPDGGEALRAKQRLALGAQLPLARRETLGHRVELAGQRRQLVAALLWNGHRVRAPAAEPLRRLGESADGPQGALGEPGDEQPDQERDAGERQDGPARGALLLLRLVDSLVHLVLEDAAEVPHLVVDTALRGLQPGGSVLQRRVRRIAFLQPRDDRRGRLFLLRDPRRHRGEARGDPIQHVAIARRLLRSADELLRVGETLADDARVGAVEGDESGAGAGIRLVQEPIRVLHPLLVEGLQGRDRPRQRHVGT
jgi:hypothetical protein